MEDDGRRQRIREVVGAAGRKEKPTIQVTGGTNVIIVNPTDDQIEQLARVLAAAPKPGGSAK